jgi:hypothetical protein
MAISDRRIDSFTSDVAVINTSATTIGIMPSHHRISSKYRCAHFVTRLFRAESHYRLFFRAWQEVVAARDRRTSDAKAIFAQRPASAARKKRCAA